MPVAVDQRCGTGLSLSCPVRRAVVTGNPRYIRYDSGRHAVCTTSATEARPMRCFDGDRGVEALDTDP